MKKVALAVIALLAASAFAAPDFTISSPTDFQVDENGLVTLTFTQFGSDPEIGRSAGVSVFHEEPDNSLVVMAYEVFQNLDSNLPSTTNPIGMMLDQLGDIGVNGITVDNEPFMAITLKPLVLPIDIEFEGYWVDEFWNEGEIGKRIVSITPEPASMLLLAAGAAFFARRRRA